MLYGVQQVRKAFDALDLSDLTAHSMAKISE
jgi:hypothetical protein